MSWDDYDEYDDYDLDGYDKTEADDYLLSERADNDKYDIDNYDRYDDDDFYTDDNSDNYDNYDDDDDYYNKDPNYDDYSTYVVNGEPYDYDELVDLADEFDLSPDDFSSTEELVETLEEAQNMVEIGADLGIDVNDYDSFESFLNAVVEEENSNKYVVNGISYDYDEITTLCRRFELEPTDFSNKEELIDILEEAQKMVRIGANLGIDIKNYDSFEKFLETVIIEEEKRGKQAKKSVENTQIKQNTQKKQTNQNKQYEQKTLNKKGNNTPKDIYYNQDEYLLADAMRDAEMNATRNANTFNDLVALGKKYDIYAEKFSNNNEYLSTLKNTTDLHKYGKQLGISREKFDSTEDYKQLLIKLAEKEYKELCGYSCTYTTPTDLVKQLNSLLKENTQSENNTKWRNNLKDGACYGINPANYKTETRYELALIDAIDKSNKPLAYDYKANAVGDVFASDFSTSTKKLSPYEKVAENYLNSQYRTNDESFTELCKFILSQSCIASRYITDKGDFLYATAVQENLALPFTFSVQDGIVTTYVVDMFMELIEYDVDFALDVFAWLLREFVPYLNYADNFSISSISYVGDLFLSFERANHSITYLSKHTDLIGLILNSPFIKTLRYKLLFSIFAENATDLCGYAKSYYLSKKVSAEDKAKSIDWIVELFLHLSWENKTKAADRIKAFLDEIYFPIILNSGEEVYNNHRENWVDYIDNVLDPDNENHVCDFDEEDEDEDCENEEDDVDEYDNQNDDQTNNNFNTNNYPADAWQNKVENGDDYGVFVEEYASEEEYLQALHKAKEKDKASSQGYINQLKNEIIDEALNQYYKEYLKEYELEVKKQKDKLEEQDEKDNKENTPYKFTRRYVADTSTYPNVNISMKNPTHSNLFRRVSALHYLRNLTVESFENDNEQYYLVALFMVNNPNVVAMNYMDTNGSAQLKRAVHDYFNLPFEIDVSNDWYFYDVIDEMFTVDYKIAAEVFCWLVKTFGPYAKYFTSELDYFENFLESIVATEEENERFFINCVKDDEKFISALPNLLEDMEYVSYLLLDAFLFDDYDTAIKIFISCFNSDNVPPNKKNDAIMQLIKSFTNVNYTGDFEVDVETNDKFFNIFLDQIFVPVVKQCKNPRIRNYFRKFDELIDEYYKELEYNLNENK